MRLTTKGRYAVTAMLDLALHESDGPVNLGEISGRQEISLSYLEQLFARLRRHGLVQSVRGPGGGYRLSEKGAAIDIASIVDAVNESYEAADCPGQIDAALCAPAEEFCLTHLLWNDLSERIHEFLSGITLAQLVERAGGGGASGASGPRAESRPRSESARIVLTSLC